MKDEIIINSIVTEVCSFYNISTAEFWNNNTSMVMNWKYPRMVSIYFSAKYTKLSLSKLGDFFKKDHATILHASKTVKNWIDTDKAMMSRIEMMDSRIMNRIIVLNTGEEPSNIEVNEFELCL